MPRLVLGIFFALTVGGMLLVAPTSADAQPAEKTKSSRYCNATYMYCVGLPAVGTAEPHLGDSPNHGVTIDLAHHAGELWSYAHWDAALLGSAKDAALSRAGLLLDEHPGGSINLTSTELDGLTAFRIVVATSPAGQALEEIVVAYRSPIDESRGPGIIYEIGVKSDVPAIAYDVRDFRIFVDSFRAQPSKAAK